MRILPILLLATTLPLLADDESSFDAPPPVNWQRYDPRALAALSPAAIFDFSGNQCHIVAPQPITEGEYYAALGLARAGLFAPAVFTDAVASVDITAWSPTTNRDLDGTFIGVFTRTQSPVAPQSVNGYSASIIDMGDGSGPGGIGRNGRLQVMLVYSESNFVPLTGYIDFPLDSTHDYRLVLASRGDVHTGRDFRSRRPRPPRSREIIGQDENFPAGRTGIMILTDRVPHAGGHFFVEATFDNFLAWDGTPPPLAIQSGAAPGTIELSCDLYRAMATDLEATTDLTQSADFWQPVIPQSSAQAGGTIVNTFSINGPCRFFRRKSL